MAVAEADLSINSHAAAETEWNLTKYLVKWVTHCAFITDYLFWNKVFLGGPGW